MTENICIMCLSLKVRMYDIKNTHLQDLYEKLTNINLKPSDAASVCYICVAQLRKCHKLKLQAVYADVVLKLARNNAHEAQQSALTDEHRVHRLALDTLRSVDIAPRAACGESEHPPLVKDEPLKRDDSDNNQSDADIGSVKQPTSDSEDDVPLNDIRVNKSEKLKKVRKRENGKGVKVDAREIILSEEQQLVEMLARAKSHNYVHSPYKCALCFKGFVDPRAYENHKQRHDERCGELACGVCGLRYRSTRQLRAHAATAHARRYVCNRCSHVAHTKNQAKEHEKWHNGHTYPCKLCGLSFSKSTTYLTHVRKCHASEFVCTRCGDSFVGRHGLLMHTAKMHQTAEGTDGSIGDQPTNEDARCTECSIQFASVDAFKRHIVTSRNHTHSHDTSSICKICEETVTEGGGMAAHLKRHARELRPPPPPAQPPGGTAPQLPCDQCSSVFASRGRLRAHVRRVHAAGGGAAGGGGERKRRDAVCELCGHRCTSHATLRYHQRRHTGERPHACPCGARFFARHELRIHARTHSGERPYACALCHKTFSQKPALNRHHRVHTGVKPYSCQLCGKSFSQSNSLKVHVRTVHLKHAPDIKKPPQDKQCQ